MIRTIGVIGAGLMGAGIAEVCACAGQPVVVIEADSRRADLGAQRIHNSLERAERSGRITTEERRTAESLIAVSVKWIDLAECDLVVEAATEDVEVKLDLFHRMDEMVQPRAILASNTSSIPIVNMAMATTRPDQVVGVHFFNPVPVMDLVEIVPSILTSGVTLDAVTLFAREVLGKTTVQSNDRAGFIVNALLVPYLLAAIRMTETGFASALAVDTAMTLGCNHPLGPLRLADLIGLDTIKSIADAMYTEFKEPHYAPVPSLLRMVEAGILGRKTGRGFYDY